MTQAKNSMFLSAQIDLKNFAKTQGHILCDFGRRKRHVILVVVAGAEIQTYLETYMPIGLLR